MSIKRQWLIIMILMALLAIIINSMLYSILIEKYFVSYIGENYDKQIIEIQDYAKYIIENESISMEQIEMEMQKYLDDPITEIQLYKSNGDNILVVRSVGMGMGMGKGMMRGQMMGQEIVEERDEYNISSGTKIIGKLVVARQGSIESSATSMIFKDVLFKNSLISGIIVLGIAIIASFFISRKTSKDLMNAADYAKSLDVNEVMEIQNSRITEVKQIQDSLILLATKLKLKGKSRKQKIDTIIHQARTPLTIIKSNLEAAKDGIVMLDENRLDSCIHQVDTLTNVISNLDKVVEIEQNMTPIKIETFDIVKEIKKMIKGFKIQFEKRNIQLTFQSHEREIISTDKYLLTQGIYNVLTNSYKFTKDGGEVQIKLEDYAENVVLTMKDNGIGIPRESIQNIFKAYYRGPNVTNITGQGLGLYIMKNNIERIGGKVEVHSKVGEGTVFQFTIPKIIKTSSDAF